jgi:hypothetical protein
MDTVNHMLMPAGLVLTVVAIAILVRDLHCERQTAHTQEHRDDRPSARLARTDSLTGLALAFLAWGPMLMVLSFLAAYSTQLRN